MITQSSINKGTHPFCNSLLELLAVLLSTQSSNDFASFLASKNIVRVLAICASPDTSYSVAQLLTSLFSFGCLETESLSIRADVVS